MTFTEAALEVLRREGKPLHFKKIAEFAVRENLLDHVGKVPEDTMADQLAAHCRLPRLERRLLPVQAGTFALVEWGLDEDPAGLDGMVELPAEDEVPYRGRERHPVPSRDMARSSGRSETGRRRREEGEERRGKRFPPPAEVAYEILAGAARPLSLTEIAAQGAERLLMPDAFVRETSSLQAALAEDNRRRETSGRMPLFQLDGDAVTLVAQPEPGEPAAAQAVPRAAATAQELRRSALAALRRRMRECDGPTVEHVAARLMERWGFRELKVAKRGREHVIFTGRRKLGITDVRHCIRVLRNNADAGRRDVNDVRRDLGHYGAQIGIVVTAGDAQRDARGEAGAAGQLPVLLMCGEAFAEALADAGVGTVPVVVPEIDEAFFRAAADAATLEEAARRARREERDRREGREGREERREGRERREPRSEVVAAFDAEGPGEGADAPLPVELPAGEGSSESLPELPAADDAEAGDEGDEAEEGPEAEGSAGEGAGESGPGGAGDARTEGGRRRRRRRRRRGGRGRGREASAAGTAAAGTPAAGTAAPPAAQDGAPPATERAAPLPPATEPQGGEGGSPGA
ncbi:MAG TPA: HTH domain-containing protein [Anaeromyxobacteraceae bacterium]|nr:HTH domain-containing protein [Anaeromyxobacteraceae bacterium]